MNITVSRKSLQSALDIAVQYADKKSTIPILTHVRIGAVGESMTLQCTDLELSATVPLAGAKMLKEGTAIVDARKLHKLVKALPDSEVRIETDAVTPERQTVKLACESTQAMLPTMQEDNWPKLASPPEKRISLDAPLLETLLGKTRYAVSEDNSRYALNVSLLVAADGKLRSVATDGHREVIAESREPWAGESFSWLLPKKYIDALRMLLRKREGTVELARDNDGQLFAVVGGTIVQSRALTGNFPSWERVVPKAEGDEYPCRFVVDSKPLAAAVKRALLGADECNRGLRFTVDSDLTVRGESSDFGIVEERVTLRKPVGDGWFAANGEYVLEAIENMAEGPVSIAFDPDRNKASEAEGCSKAFVIRPLAEEDVKVLAILMPMRL